MIVPLTLADFLERAEQVYGDREAVIDEPNPPGGGLGRITYGEFAAMSRSLAAALDDLGVRDGERVAIVSPNAARFLVSLFGVSVFGRVIVPVNFRLNVEEVRYIIEHSGSTVALIDPELDEPLKQLNVKHRFVLGTSTDAQLFGRRNAAPAGPRDRRERDRVDQLHVGHDRAAQGRSADAPRLLAERGDVRLAPGPLGSRRLPAHLADVSLQRLGHALRGHRDRRAPGDHPQDRRRGNSPAGRGSRGDPVQLRAGGDRGGARRGRRPASARGERAGRRARAGRGRRSAAPVEDDRAHRGRARLGVHPDLRTHRDLAAAHDQPRAPGMGRRRPERAGAAALAGRRAGRGRTHGRRRERRDPHADEQRLRGLLEPARGDREGAGGRLVPHRRRRPYRRRLRRDRRPKEGRDHHRRRERVSRSRSRTASTSTPPSPRPR